MNSVAVDEPPEGARERRGRGGREAFLPFLLLLPAVGLMLALYAYPFISSVYRSFLVKGQGALTLANYAKVSELYLRDIVFTLEIAILSTAVAAVLSILLATYLRLGSGRVARLIGLVYRLPIFIPFVVVAQMMTTFLAPHGLLNVGLAQVGLVNLDTPPDLLNWKGLTFAFVWKQWAFMTLIVLSGFEMVDNTYIEAARSFGARLPQVILRILVPMSRASLSVALILAFTSTVGTFTLPYMLIGGKTPTTLTVDIAHRVTYFGDYGVANALGTVAYVLVVFTAVYYLRYTLKRGVYEQYGAAMGRKHLLTRSAEVVALVVLCLLIFGPMLGLVIWSVALRWYWPNLLPQEIGTDYWRQALGLERSLAVGAVSITGSLRTSLVLALLVVAVVMLLSTPVGYVLAKYRIPFKGAILLLFLMPQAFPQQPVFVNLLLVFTKLGLAGTFQGVLLVHLMVCLVFSVWISTAAFKAVPPELEEAARSVGAGGLRTFFRITLPLAMPGLLASAVFVFLTSLDEFTGTFFIGLPFVATLPMLLYSSSGFNLQFASVIAIVLLVPSILFMVIIERFLKAEYIGGIGV